MDTLQNRGNPFKPHTRINGRLRQRCIDPVSRTIKLHEYEIPNLDKAVSTFIFGAWRATKNIRTMVIKYFTTRTTRPRVTHCPKIIFRPNPPETCFRYTDVVQPDARRIVIVFINCDPELFCWQPENLCEQLPRVLDRIALEIIAKTEIAQHLEEGMVPRGIAYVF